MQANTRNSFVISRALRNFLAASILTSLASQLAVTTDAVIVSHMIGPDAISAINITMPVNMLFSCVSILIGLGASILAARAIGQHDNNKVNHIFSVSMLLLALLGIAVSVTTYIWSEEIISSFCTDTRVYPLAVEYTNVITAGAIFLIFSNGINYFVSTDGNPSLVARGVVVGAVANIILDIILVHFMGIAGSALATIINYTITLAVVATHFRKKSSSYRLMNPLRGLARQCMKNIYEGLPLMLGNLLLGLAVLAINKMILSASGADGLYIWSICLQVLMITFVVLNGVGNAMLSIGGVLVGEKDYNGVRILTSLSLKFVCSVLALFVATVIIYPQFLGYIFGNGTGQNIQGVDSALRIFSLLLIPFAVTLTMRFLFQILEYRILSLVMSAGQLAFIIACLWIFIEIAPGKLWWSFPFSAIMLIAIQIATTLVLWLKRKNISPITLIPGKDNSSIDLSISYTATGIEKATAKIREFLNNDVENKTIEVYIENLKRIMTEVIDMSCDKKHCFDMHIKTIKGNVTATLRATGKKFVETEFTKTLSHTVEFKYMHGQNVLFITPAME